MKRVTIKDIAAKAGVANSTVTNALNPDSKKISEKKRAEILKIVEEMNYHPMKSAQNLSNKNKKVVGFLMRTSENFNDGLINQKYIYYLNKYAHERNLELVTIVLSHDEEQGYREIEKAIFEYNLSHIIIQGIDIDQVIESNISHLNIPKILIEIPIVNETTKYISTDNYKAQYELTETVIKENDINKVLYITGFKGAYVSIERERGFVAAAKKLKLDYDIVEGTFDHDKILPIIKDINLEQYDYIACGSDLIVATIADYCQRLGYEKIIFSGFDGVDYLNYFKYKMYTVHQLVGMLSTEIIDMIIEDKIETKLIDYRIECTEGSRW